MMTGKKWSAIGAAIGIVVGFAAATVLQSMLDAGARSKAKRTAGDCRSISIALEDYRKANGRYPPLDGNVEHLAPYLVPTYMRVLPKKDMAGQPLLVLMKGSTPAVISTGRYGIVAQSGD